MKMNKFLESKTLRIALYGLGGLIVALAIFNFGMFVGYKKASFSFGWGENYDRNFVGPRRNMMGLEDRYFTNDHGVAGQIIKIDGSDVVIRGKDNTEKMIVVSSDAGIMRFREAIKIGDLKVDDYIVVIGNPNSSGQIEAKLIRVMPNPESNDPAFRPVGPIVTTTNDQIDHPIPTTPQN
jgi:hypothetical protein